MGLFKVSGDPIKQASVEVATKGKGAQAAASDGGIVDTLKELWDKYSLYVYIGAGVFILWKWVLPMLGIGKKKRRGNAGSLAKARRARAAKRGRL